MMIIKPVALMAMCSLLILSGTIGFAQQKTVDVDKVMQVAEAHLANMAAANNDLSRYPRSTNPDGSLHRVKSADWTSGFFPGSLWYMYNYSSDKRWEERARNWTAAIEKEQYNKTTHDLGFMIYCPFGNGYRFTGDPVYKQVILRAAASLASRYSTVTGCIKSWDKSGYTFPVIIDNMMNLELLFEATRQSGDSSYYKVAVNHANSTLQHHFRKDNSSYHVVDYDTITGKPLRKITHQGYQDESAWARGQAWGLYGYTVAYRYTLDRKYLQQAEKIASFYLNHPRMPADHIPYWDFNAPVTSITPRDASAAAIVASGLLELAGYSANKSKYLNASTQIISSLSSPAYLAAPGTNNNFVLMHSTGHMPHKSEIDVPINYADYYFIESLIRLKKFDQKSVTSSTKKPAVGSSNNTNKVSNTSGPADLSADLVVYTGNPGGIMTAIAAAREGVSVLLVEPSAYLGGIIAQGGLCVSDIGSPSTIGGLSRNFFTRIASYYSSTYGPKSAQLRNSVIDGMPGTSFEPKVAEAMFETMLSGYPNIKVIRNATLARVNRDKLAITSIVCMDTAGKTITVKGKVFADASYTGDLMAAGNVSYLLGTDSKHIFGERSVPDKSSPAIQAFNYRVTLTNDPSNRVEVKKPDGYDPKAYDIRLMALRTDSTSRVFKTYWKLPNGKIDANIADFPGENWGYPEAGYAERKTIEERHRKNSLGYIYFLQNDSSVPRRIRNEAIEWGLAKDEFADNGNFPRHIYIREGRRLKGEYVMKQQDLQINRSKEDAIALGSYSMDSHATTVSIKADGTRTYSGGGIWEPVKAYEISYRSLIPVAKECTNLLVPVCLSSSHMAWTSLRMEPVFMMAGEAAGVAAALAIKDKVSVQNVPVNVLRQKLNAKGALTSLPKEVVAGFTWHPLHPGPGTTVKFTVQQEKNTATPVKYYWDFNGDGKVDGTSASEERILTAEKIHLVSLVTEDVDGRRSQPVAKFIPVGNAQAGDVQIDSEDSLNVIVKQVKKSIAQTPFWGTFYHTDGNLNKGFSFAAYAPLLQKAGDYDVYVSSVPGNGRSTNTLVEVEHAKGKQQVYIDQRKGDPLFGLIYLGSFPFAPGKSAKVTIFNNDPDKYILYDVARWVLRSDSAK